MEGREIATRYERLSRLTNAELARLGLTRQDIPRVAVNGLAGSLGQRFPAGKRRRRMKRARRLRSPGGFFAKPQHL